MPSCSGTRISQWKRVGPLLILLATLVACGTTAPTSRWHGSSASCVAPYLDSQTSGAKRAVTTPTVAPGDVLMVHGHWYASTCNDTGGHAPVEPLGPVRLEVALPGGSVLQLGEFTPSGPDLGFSVEIKVPVSAPAGAAEVRDDREVPATFDFVVGGNLG